MCIEHVCNVTFQELCAACVRQWSLLPWIERYSTEQFSSTLHSCMLYNGVYQYTMIAHTCTHCVWAAHNDYVEQARRREEWQIANNRENGVNDMVELYCERGMAVADAQTVVGALSKYDKFFVDVMLSEELGLPNYKVLNFAGTSAMVLSIVLYTYLLAAVVTRAHCCGFSES
eukprot:11574-Heterococcus_DN1.PRE.4